MNRGSESARVVFLPTVAGREFTGIATRWSSVSVIVNEGTRDMGPNCPKRLDCGIAMLHIALSAAVHGIRDGWRGSEPSGVAAFEA